MVQPALSEEQTKLFTSGISAETAFKELAEFYGKLIEAQGLLDSGFVNRHKGPHLSSLLRKIPLNFIFYPIATMDNIYAWVSLRWDLLQKICGLHGMKEILNTEFAWIATNFAVLPPTLKLTRSPLRQLSDESVDLCVTHVLRALVKLKSADIDPDGLTLKPYRPEHAKSIVTVFAYAMDRSKLGPRNREKRIAILRFADLKELVKMSKITTTAAGRCAATLQEALALGLLDSPFVMDPKSQLPFILPGYPLFNEHYLKAMVFIFGDDYTHSMPTGLRIPPLPTRIMSNNPNVNVLLQAGQDFISNFYRKSCARAHSAIFLIGLEKMCELLELVRDPSNPRAVLPNVSLEHMHAATALFDKFKVIEKKGWMDVAAQDTSYISTYLAAHEKFWKEQMRMAGQ
ncbi:hypothetical protein BDV95DRAFT_614316 [Massariosphaeria phaeospora]|uniref:Uncharacterized protein n=1 Tax=Massariosphaeria phaeospora TaxID=100035 RepID=A0A7C8MFC0_9PLEO|nr:hypothetical protein BDV95DRAFT_614316 [Massariosphaeria phaeospora]